MAAPAGAPVGDPSREGHGWWPYIAPYGSFLLLGEIGSRLPEALDPVMLFLKPAVPAALLVAYWRRGMYPELRNLELRVGTLAVDALLGIVLAFLWMAPFVLFPEILVFDWMRPDPSEGFDPELLGASLVPVALAVRMLGYAVVTPYFEELFMRSFVMRYAEVYDGRKDFRDVPIGTFGWTSFLTTLVFFTFTHVPWEFGVMFLWSLLTNLWLYHRKNLLSLVVVHGFTNGSILVLVTVYTGYFLDAEGRPLPLWFFV